MSETVVESHPCAKKRARMGQPSLNYPSPYIATTSALKRFVVHLHYFSEREDTP